MWEEDDPGAGTGIPGEASGPLQLGAQIPRKADCLLIPEVVFASLDSPPAGNCLFHRCTTEPAFPWDKLGDYLAGVRRISRYYREG